jgi:enoyl-CoA hydratase/carnithine racemase
MGLVNKVVAPDELLSTTHAYARILATEVSPASLAATKLQLYADLHRDAASAVRDSEARVERMMTEPDFAEGVAAWIDKRLPRFPSGRPT